VRFLVFFWDGFTTGRAKHCATQKRLFFYLVYLLLEKLIRAQSTNCSCDVLLFRRWPKKHVLSLVQFNPPRRSAVGARLRVCAAPFAG
jgi:hypothetical protein